MIAADEDALQCDLAETYGVFDYRSLTPTMAARLAAGLRNGSRIQCAMAGLGAPLSTVMLAACLDQLTAIRAMLVGETPTERITPLLLMDREEPAPSGRFASGEDFESWRAAKLKES